MIRAYPLPAIWCNWDVFNLEFATGSVFASLNLHFLHPLSRSNKKHHLIWLLPSQIEKTPRISWTEKTRAVPWKEKNSLLFLTKIEVYTIWFKLLSFIPISIPQLGLDIKPLVAGCKVLFCSEGCRAWSLGLVRVGIPETRIISNDQKRTLMRSYNSILSGVTTPWLGAPQPRL